MEDLIAVIADHVEQHNAVVGALNRTFIDRVAASGDAILGALEAGNKVIVFGNGGSAAQADHLAGELTGRFKKNRNPLPCLNLSAGSGLMTCIANDFGFDTLFERQIQALANEGDVAIGLTTSGRSQNVLRGLATARNDDAVTIAMTGETGLSGVIVDHTIAAPSADTAFIQEVHLMVIHAWCRMVDAAFG